MSRRRQMHSEIFQGIVYLPISIRMNFKRMKTISLLLEFNTRNNYGKTRIIFSDHSYSGRYNFRLNVRDYFMSTFDAFKDIFKINRFRGMLLKRQKQFIIMIVRIIICNIDIIYRRISEIGIETYKMYTSMHIQIIVIVNIQVILKNIVRLRRRWFFVRK